MTKIKVPFKKLKRIIHLADIHIRLFKRHDEYRECFEQLYTDISASNLSNTAIVVAGDIVHAKTDLSPEAVELASEFLSRLADLAPTIVIAGNHDFNMANKSRLDSLTPIIKNVHNPNLHYLKYSGIYQMADVDFYVWSLIDESSDWPAVNVSDNRHKICLFHGPVHNAKTDIGYTITNRHVLIENFYGFDMVLLGDIHKHQVLQEYDAHGNPIVVYSSSLIQQNHGEHLRGHGWCDWDVSNRSFKFNELHNNYGYYTLRIEHGVVPDYSDMPDNVRLRIFAGDFEASNVKQLTATIRKSHTVKELGITSFDGAKQTTHGFSSGTALDVLDVNIQNGLLHDWASDAFPNMAPDVWDKVLKINREANAEVDTEDIARKIMWTPISLKFDNLFTYGEGNFIDFTTLKGTVGIFAPNRSGKTSIAEAICFALYDRTPRTQRAANIMNFDRVTCFVEFKFQIDEVVYTITRKGAKNKKGEVKIDVDFSSKDIHGNVNNLNGEQRVYTNQNIRSYVGDYEDFILTTFSSSSSQGLFIDRGHTDRKDLLSQFMGLTIFDKLHKFANEESREVASALKRFKSDDFTQELVDVQDEIMILSASKTEAERVLSDVNDQLNDLTDSIQHEYEQKIPTNVKGRIDVMHGRAALAKTEFANTCSTLKDLVTRQDDLNAKLDRGKVKLDTEYSTVEADYKSFLKATDAVRKTNNELRLRRTLQHSYEDELTRLTKHEYDPNCEFCIKNGRSTIEATTATQEKILDVLGQIDEISTRLAVETAELERYTGIEEKNDKLQTGRKWISSTQNELIRLQTEITKFERLRVRYADELESAERDIEEYNESLAIIEANKAIDDVIKQLEVKKSILKNEFVAQSSTINQLTSKIAVLNQRKTDMLNRIKEAIELEEKYEAYEIYLSAVCRDGLPYKLISDVLPNLEITVNDLLQQMAEFSLKFETDGKNVLMKIHYEDGKIGPLEMASGMEKFISSLAIRVALTTISSLPKSNFLIIDEGLGALDADNLNSVSMLFDVLKTKFEFVFLISHVDSVRDVADTLAEIERKNGFSKIII